MEAMIAMSDDIGKSSDPLGGDVMDVDVKPRSRFERFVPKRLVSKRF
jgi:hypothetical protein